MKKLCLVLLIMVALTLSIISDETVDQAMTILPNGNVGIGTTEPGEKLEVNGNLKVDGEIQAIINEKIKNLMEYLNPVGTIQAYGGTTDPDGWPDGWFICDGRALSRVDYADLFAIIGTAFGYGNGSTTFNIPDLRGHFLRGVSGSSNRDPDKNSRDPLKTGGNSGNKVGSYQGDQFKSHSHAIRGYGVTSADRSGQVIIDDDRKTTPFYQDTEPKGGSETRSKNVYVNFIIKY